MATTTNEWRTVNLSDVHHGQIVTPEVQYRVTRPHPDSTHQRYAVRYRMHDASEPPGRRAAEWHEHAGDYWACVRWLQSEGIQIGDTRGF